jgi:streptogramin lyase
MDRGVFGGAWAHRLLAGAAAAIVPIGALGAAGVLRMPRDAAAHPPAVGVIQELSAGTSRTVYLSGLTTGPDGDLWFTNAGCMGTGQCTIARLAASGTLVVFRRGLNSGSVPLAIATGPDGDLWFTDEGSMPAIGRVTPAGRITEYSHGLDGGEPFEITAGPGGDVWFTEQGRRPAIGRITPAGRITDYTHGLQDGSVPFGITAGPGGSIWFTDRGCTGTGRCAVGRLTAGGHITEFTAGLRPGAEPLGIAAGPGHVVWFADSSGAIGRATATGALSERSQGLRAGSSPVAIAPGPDGSMWFTDEGSRPAVGRVSRSGALREFTAGLLTGSQPAFIAPAADGRMWFSDEGGLAAIGAVTTGAPPALRRAPAVAGQPAVGAPARCVAARWSRWAGARPSPRRFRFDGYGWARDGDLLPGRARAYTPSLADSGARLACQETVTYPAPLSVTAVAQSADALIAP